MAKRVIFGISLLVGLGLFALVLLRLGSLEEAPAELARFGVVAVLIYFANAAVTLAAPALSWLILMRGEGIRVSYWTALKANLMGAPLNMVTPTLHLGGEPLKMVYVANLAGVSKHRVLATILVAKFQEFGGLFLVMIAAVWVSVWRLDLTPRQETLLVGAMAMLMVPFAITLYAFIRNWQPTVKSITALARLGIATRRLARLRLRARDMERIVHAAFTERWRSFIPSQAAAVVSAASIFMRVWIFFGLSGVLLGADQLSAVYVITNVANSLPVPGGLGVFEGGVALFSQQVLYQIADEGLTAFLIVNRAADVFLVLVGLYFIAVSGLRALARSVAKGDVSTNVRDAKRTTED